MTRRLPSLSALARGAVVTALVIGAANSVQGQEPPRPQLPRGADARHWEPYFDFGVEKFKRTPIAAEEAFYWSSRLDPTRAEPLFARYAAFFAHTKDQDVAGFFRGDEEILSRPDIRAADSLRSLALVRNPFVHRGLEVLIFDRLPGKFAVDRDTKAWIAYSNGQFSKAADAFVKNPTLPASSLTGFRAFAREGGLEIPEGDEPDRVLTRRLVSMVAYVKWGSAGVYQAEARTDPAIVEAAKHFGQYSGR